VLDQLEATGGLESITAKFDGLAPGYSGHDYADASRYFRRRVEVLSKLGPRVAPGASVLDLGCGDAGMAVPLQACGWAYHGVDASPGMLAEASARLGPSCRFDRGDLEMYEPDEPVDLTVCFRAVVYAKDRPAFFRRVRSYTQTKFVFDFNPRVQDRREIERDLASGGFTHSAFRAFFLPQLVGVRAPLRVSLRCLESVPPAAKTALRVRGIWLCAAWTD
jgi:ubiquinone/menaquinone biosynthesis C-methylase UbiE